MTILVLGIILFCLVHLLPATLPSVRGALQEKLGDLGVLAVEGAQADLGVVRT